MSKISEELIKLSSKPAVGGAHRRTIKLPSYAIKNESNAKSKIINNIIPIDSFKNNHSKTHKRNLCLNLGYNNTQHSTPLDETYGSDTKNTIEPITQNAAPVIENFETPINNFSDDIDPIDQLLEYLNAQSSYSTTDNSIINSDIIASEPKVEENINIDKKPVINLGSPFFYTPSVFKQYDIAILDANGAEEDVHAEAKRILEESINASKNKEITSQIKIVNTDLPRKTKVVKKVVAKKKATTETEPASKKAVIKKKTVVKTEPENKKVVTKKKAATKAESTNKKVVVKKKTVIKEKPTTEKITPKKVVVKTEAKATKPVPKRSIVSENKTVKIEPVAVQPIIENKKTASIVTAKPTKIKVSAKSKGLDAKKDFVDLDALISQDTVNEAYMQSINNINPTAPVINNIVVTKPVLPVEPIIKETVSPIVEPVIKESANPVGILVETQNTKTNKKINTPKASTFNSIFKKFSYDEAELINSANDLVDDSPSIQSINKVPEVGQTLENAKIGQEKNVTELNVQASPIATIPVIENDVDVITSIDPSNNYTSENDVNILNVLSTQNNVYSSVEPIVTIEDLLTLNRNIKTEKSTDVVPSDIEISAEEINNEEITNTNDTDFSIENYFDLGSEVSDSEENSELNYDDSVGEELIDDNADIEFEIKTEKNSSEDEQKIIDEIIKELDEEFVFEDIQDYELEEQNEDIVIEDNNYKSVEDSIFDNMLNDISLDDIDLEDLSSLTIADVISKDTTEEENIVEESNPIEEINEDDIDIEDLLDIEDDNSIEEIDENDIDIEDILDNDIEIDDIIDNVTEEENIVENLDVEEIDEDENEIELEYNDEDAEISSLSDYVSNDAPSSENEIESILEYAMSSNKNISNTDLKEKLLTELFGANIDAESDTATLNINGINKDITSDFLKVIDTLTQTISKLEQKNSQPDHIIDELGKAINIEIDKDDIFSISILNETYEIVADFDGISVLSENIHISTPKNNFFVNIGDKYIEIHNQKTNFVVYTNFEDVEFANALNNVAFTKKNNRIELTIKEAFKLSSGNNKISLSMLNTSIADIEGTQALSNDDEETSVCDNKTLVISEETQKVYLPYTIKDIMEKLNDTATGYQTVQDVIDEEYIIPLSEFKMPIVSRFKEAYKFMREKENSSVYAAIDLALELMFNSNLNPAVIRACKNLRELNIYLDCLYENELEKFDCFKVIYKVLPKIQ